MGNWSRSRATASFGNSVSSAGSSTPSHRAALTGSFSSAPAALPFFISNSLSPITS